MPKCDGDPALHYCSTLLALRQRSLRRGLWHRVLDRLERAQVNLTLRMVKTVRSPLLRQVLDAIMNKLADALQSKVMRVMRSVGYASAWQLGQWAQRWGHPSADTWAQDGKFARFLAVVYVNSKPSGPF